MQDDQAIEMLKAGDLRGLEPLINRYSLQALRTAVLIVQDNDLAEDVIQSAFVQAASKIKQLNSNCFWSWFLKIVIRGSIKTAKKQARWISLDRTLEGQVIAVEEWLVDQRPLPEDQIVTEEFQIVVWNALAELKPEVRAIVIMKYYLGMSQDEIKETLGHPLSTIKWRLFSARRMLRSLLSAEVTDRKSSCQEEFKNESD